MKHLILTAILLASLTASMLAGCGQTETASAAETQTGSCACGLTDALSILTVQKITKSSIDHEL